MATASQWADTLAKRLTPLLREFPDGFFDTFEHTSTGNNYCHPMALGLLTKVLWDLPGTAAVGVDVRLNLGKGAKFQPDLVAFDDERRPTLFVDYESPNSSDARVPWKDVDKYCGWNARSRANVPYVIVTTLPNNRTDHWELRYAYGDGWNVDFKGRHADVCKNPFRFWYQYYTGEFRKRCMDHVALVNIDCRTAHRAYPD